MIQKLASCSTARDIDSLRGIQTRGRLCFPRTAERERAAATLERLAEIPARRSRQIYRSPAERAASAAGVIVANPRKGIGVPKITRCVCQARAATNLHRAEGSGPRSTAGRPARERLRRPLEAEEGSRPLFDQKNGRNVRDNRKSCRSNALDRQQPACKARFVAALGPRIVVRMTAFAVGTLRTAAFAAVFGDRSNLRGPAAPRAVMFVAGMVVQRLNGRGRQQVCDQRRNDPNTF